MFGFHVQSGYLMELPSKGGLLKEFPQFCTKGSFYRPDLISELKQVIPKLVKPELAKTNVPLFYPMIIKSKSLTPVDIIDNNTPFCLVCYPDPQHPPKDQFIVKEYWSLIQPMVICRDVSGYYLATPGDTNIVMFRKTNEQGEAWLCKAISNYNEFTSYGSPVFSQEKINIVRYLS
jgi:hypothetical protein